MSINDPDLWLDQDFSSPPAQYNAVAEDGRYWWTNNSGAITYTQVVQTVAVRLVWEVVSSNANAASAALEYSVDTGTTWTTIDLGGFVAKGAIELPGQQIAANALQVRVTGASSYGPTVAIRIEEEVNYNCECVDEQPYETKAQLRRRMLVQLGYAVQADNPPPGMTDLIDDFVTSAQRQLYLKYSALRTRRFFKWTVDQGVRFYDMDEPDDSTCGFLNPQKTIEWVGIQDSRNVWYPLVEGIDPSLYTLNNNQGRPQRFEIRQCIEIWPPPDPYGYTLWVKGHFGLQSFTADGDKTTIDSELVFLFALARAKKHYGKPDADAVAEDANTYLANIVAGLHGKKRYIPGARIIPPATQPVMVHFDTGAP